MKCFKENQGLLLLNSAAYKKYKIIKELYIQCINSGSHLQWKD